MRTRNRSRKTRREVVQEKDDDIWTRVIAVDMDKDGESLDKYER